MKGSDTSTAGLDQVIHMLDSDNDGSVSKSELMWAINDNRLPNMSRSIYLSFQPGQSTCGIMLLQKKEDSDLKEIKHATELSPGNNSMWSKRDKIWLHPDPQSRSRELEKLGVSSELNFYSQETIWKMPYPCAEMVFDKVEVYDLNPMTGKRDELVHKWGLGDDIRDLLTVEDINN